VIEMVFNGGEPIGDCPQTWEQAKEWESLSNGVVCIGFPKPTWRFDCGFKLDYDGPLIDISSRFYPPKTHYGKSWDGDLNIRIKGKSVYQRSFDCETLDQLKTEVSNFTKNLSGELVKLFDKINDSGTIAEK